MSTATEHALHRRRWIERQNKRMLQQRLLQIIFWQRCYRITCNAHRCCFSERLCHTATEHVFVCVGPTVDGSRPCLAACRTKIEQAHLWILICVCFRIFGSQPTCLNLPRLVENIVWGPRAGIIVFVGSKKTRVCVQLLVV